MSHFSVPVVSITAVSDHPNADRLSINKILGFEAITNKHDDGSPRYEVGELVAYVPEDAIVPENLLRRMGFWDEDARKGSLAGADGNRVKAVKLRGVVSQGLIIPLMIADTGSEEYCRKQAMKKAVIVPCNTKEGDDLADYLNITKRVIIIPSSMSGEMYVCEDCVKYDFDSLQRHPDMFTEGENVEVTEKLHGTFCQVGSTNTINSDGFGDGSIYITSKGMGEEYRAFKNNEINRHNLYVKTVRATGFLDRPKPRSGTRIFGEVFGKGVQDLGYGTSGPEFRVFDISIDKTFLSPDERNTMAEDIGLATVPVLYRGPFSMETMIALRDGKTTISEGHIREGIVIRSTGRERKIAKLVSPAYLTRKGDATEYQ